MADALKVGYRTRELPLIRYCSWPRCERLLGSLSTSRGVCSVFHGQPMPGTDPRAQWMQAQLAAFFPPPPVMEADDRLMLSNVKRLSMLVDLHNSDVFGSEDRGNLSMKISEWNTYINQVNK